MTYLSPLFYNNYSFFSTTGFCILSIKWPIWSVSPENKLLSILLLPKITCAVFSMTIASSSWDSNYYSIVLIWCYYTSMKPNFVWISCSIDSNNMYFAFCLLSRISWTQVFNYSRESGHCDEILALLKCISSCLNHYDQNKFTYSIFLKTVSILLRRSVYGSL